MSKVRVTLAPSSRLSETSLETAQFGTVFSDHMLIANYENGHWGEPRSYPMALCHCPRRQALYITDRRSSKVSGPIAPLTAGLPCFDRATITPGSTGRRLDW